MNALLQNKMNELVSLCRVHGVEKLSAFGSVCTDNFSNESDVDLLVSFGKVPLETYADNYFDLKEELENLFSREVIW